MNFGKGPDEEYENEDMDARDDLDFDDDEDEGSLLRWVSVLFVLAAVGGFVALAWYAYKSGMQPVSEDEIPYVAAEETPLKEKPADPGGWQFEHQDKSVYNQLAAGNSAAERPVAERILPAPEEPVERPQIEQVNPEDFEREEVTGAVGGVVETPIPATPAKEAVPEPEVVMEPTPAEEEESVAEVPAAKSDEEKISVIESKEPESKPEPKPAPAAATPAPATASGSGQYMAQLGAFGSDEDARAAWEKISAAHGSMFPTKNYIVQRADLGSKGVFHRLQMGPFESETAARKVCEYLQQNKQGCFVVKK